MKSSNSNTRLSIWKIHPEPPWVSPFLALISPAYFTNQCGFPTDYGWSKANFCSCNKQCCYLYLHLLLLKITSQKILLRSRFASDRNPTLGKFRSLAARIIKFVASITILCCSNHQVRWFNVSLLLLEGLSLPVKNLQLLLQFSKNQPFSLEYPMQISKKNRLNLPVFTGKSIFLNISSMIFPGFLHLGASNCPGPRLIIATLSALSGAGRGPRFLGFVRKMVGKVTKMLDLIGLHQPKWWFYGIWSGLTMV